MRVGVFQALAGELTPGQRLERLSKALGQQSVDLVVCPELFSSGYHVGSQLEERAETVEGPFFLRMAELARSSATALIYGHPERDGDRLYNAATCIDCRGQRLATRRKLVLPPGFENRFFSAGESNITLFDLEGVRCAILICYEAEFPESMRHVAEAGAEVAAVPTALSAQWHDVAHKLIPTRAFENGLWVLYANYAGEENGLRYLGSSCINAPDGADIARAGDEATLVTAWMDVGMVKAARSRLPYLRDLQRLRRHLCERAAGEPEIRNSPAPYSKNVT